MSSDTPRTDKAEAMGTIPFEQQEMVLVANVVPSDFARQLERENARLRAALQELVVAIESDRHFYTGGSYDKAKLALNETAAIRDANG